MTDNTLVIIVQMLIATIMGSLIGSERKSHGFEIGGRTYALVALGAAVVTSFARDVFGENAPHIIAGVLSRSSYRNRFFGRWRYHKTIVRRSPRIDHGYQYLGYGGYGYRNRGWLSDSWRLRVFSNINDSLVEKYPE